MQILKKTPSFKANTTILSHNGLLNKKQICSLKKIGESIGTPNDSIYFNVREFKKNRILIAHRANFENEKNAISVNSFLMRYKFLFKPETYINNAMNRLKKMIEKKN